MGNEKVFHLILEVSSPLLLDFLIQNLSSWRACVWRSLNILYLQRCNSQKKKKHFENQNSQTMIWEYKVKQPAGKSFEICTPLFAGVAFWLNMVKSVWKNVRHFLNLAAGTWILPFANDSTNVIQLVSFNSLFVFPDPTESSLDFNFLKIKPLFQYSLFIIQFLKLAPWTKFSGSYSFLIIKHNNSNNLFVCIVPGGCRNNERICNQGEFETLSKINQVIKKLWQLIKFYIKPYQI